MNQFYRRKTKLFLCYLIVWSIALLLSQYEMEMLRIQTNVKETVEQSIAEATNSNTESESEESSQIEWSISKDESLEETQTVNSGVKVQEETDMEEMATTVEMVEENDTLEQQVETYLAQMTVEEKVAQLFIVLPEALVNTGNTVTAAGEATRQAICSIPVGGLIYMEANLISKEQVQQMLANVQSYSLERIGLPMFTCVDEEGGSVARISGKGRFAVPTFPNMCEIGAVGDLNQVYEIGRMIGCYLSELGFNVDFAPVADVWSNANNQVVQFRSFGMNAALVADMSVSVMNGLHAYGVCSTFKHFPGHGATAEDTHAGYAYVTKTLEELQACELIPFQSGIQQGVDFIMVGHLCVPAITGDNTPTSLSYAAIQQLLREQMGYDGIVITDALNMGAITADYTSEEAAVNTILAGADMILMPVDFSSAYQGVLAAVKNQTISMERLDESLRRILRVKLTLP